MSLRRKKYESLDPILRDAWRSQWVLHPGAGWKAGVMSAIRNGMRPDEEPAAVAAPSIVLRFSIATALFALLFIVYALVSGMVPYGDLAMLFMNDPAGFILSAPFV